jgi:glutamyl-tRNA synthetase
MAIDKKIIRAYALKNAVEHEGKAFAGSVISGLFNHGLSKDGIKDIMPDLNSVLKEVNSFSADKQKIEFEKLTEIIGHRPERGDELPELPDVPSNGVIMRFSPSSSASAFHIGHILTGMPTSLYVKKYGGKFYLRIEDTNPEKTVPECYDSFPKEAEWIFGNITEWYAQSDKIKEYYDFAEKLIGKGLAFVCTCRKTDEEDEESKTPRKVCGCRNNSIKDNFEKWKKMLDKKGFLEGEAVLRFKSPDTQLSNLALIDFPLARINLTSHPRQGKKYRVWPLMNLCVTYDDMTQKCTHIIRAKEHRDNAKRQEMIFDCLKVKKPITYFLGRYKFVDLPISKTQITEMIKEGKFEGWDDIRLPLARNFKRRGYLPLAFAKMAIQRGISEVDKVISQKDFFEVLNSFNRELLKDKVRRIDFLKCNEKDANISILMPDNKKVYGKINVKPKKDEIVYFNKFGYAKLNSTEGNGKNLKNVFWFCHE